MKNITLREVCERLLANDNILLITHKNPDGDAVASVASMYGILKKLGKNVCVVFPDEPVERLGFISGDMEYYTWDNRDKIPFSDFIVSLDCAASSRFGRLEGEFADKVNLSIDPKKLLSGSYIGGRICLGAVYIHFKMQMSFCRAF